MQSSGFRVTVRLVCVRLEWQAAMAATAATVAMVAKAAMVSTAAKNFKRLVNCKDQSDLDEILTESIAVQKTFI